MKSTKISPADLESRAELLKERIYATLALLAILLTIDTAHTSPQKAAVIIAGAALSLWAASLIASRMSYRIIMQHRQPDVAELDRQFVRHSPLLAAAFFPLLVDGFSIIGFISLHTAINLAIGASLLLLLGWSLLSARSMRAGRLSTLILAGAYVAIGLAVVALKTVVGH
jgi:hypothetical protein